MHVLNVRCEFRAAKASINVPSPGAYPISDIRYPRLWLRTLTLSRSDAHESGLPRHKADSLLSFSSRVPKETVLNAFLESRTVKKVGYQAELGLGKIFPLTKISQYSHQWQAVASSFCPNETKTKSKAKKKDLRTTELNIVVPAPPGLLLQRPEGTFTADVNGFTMRFEWIILCLLKPSPSILRFDLDDLLRACFFLALRKPSSVNSRKLE